MRPSDAKTLNDADVVFRISEAIEPFTSKVVKSLPKTVQVVTLAEVPGLKLLPRRIGSNFEKHDGGAKGHTGHAGHGHGAKEAVGRGQSIDGHVWLDPENAKLMLGHIATVLTAKRPALGDAFKANAVKAAARMDALSNELAVELQPIAGKPYVVFHDAFQYLEARYGLAPVGSITVDPETPPSGKRLTELRKKIQTLGATCVFSEPGFEARVVQSVIEGTPARTASLDPEGLSVAKGADAYEALMRALAKGLKRCLAP
jgi:zinc transport system substrate-binding protein